MLSSKEFKTSRVDYRFFREIADEVGAKVVADIAHPAGLIACDLLKSPLPHCHAVTTTTHKTLRGPRGGMILIGRDEENDLGMVTPKGRKKKWSEIIDSNVFPGFQGGPLMHVIAAKAVAFKEALEPSFVDYSKQVILNAQALAQKLLDLGYDIVSDGTDTHLMLVDLRNRNLTGKECEEALENAGITVNKNMVPDDPQPPDFESTVHEIIKDEEKILEEQRKETKQISGLKRMVEELSKKLISLGREYAGELEAKDRKILELRERARETLGERFDLKAFHNTVLGSGAVPLSVLEQIVDDYIAAAK